MKELNLSVCERVAVFADLHYTCESSAVKGAVLRWAVAEAHRRGAKAIVCAGDMVGNGLVAEAREVAAILAGAGIPVSFTHGNAEGRTPSEAAAARDALAGAPPPRGVALLDSSAGWCDPGWTSSLPAGSCGLLAVTHVPPQSWGAAAADEWRAATESGVLSLTVAGHVHADTAAPGLFVTRGLDPDKAAGGPPAFAVFRRGAAGWEAEAAAEMPGVRPEEWPDAFRRAWREDLGLSTMYDPFGGLDFAIAAGVANVELRDGSWRDGDFSALLARVADWRAAGGRRLSLHLPVLSFADGRAAGVEALARSCRAAVALGCDRVTLHVPSMPVSDYAANRRFVRDAHAEGLAPLVGSGVAVGVENMHMAPSGETPERRRFGYTPGECAAQIALLREIPGLAVGFHCDIGHARNNAPFSTRYPVGAWYELLGSECNGMHIHQVVDSGGGHFSNHRPLTGFFDKLISLSSLVLARRDGILPRVPMFLEIRDDKGPACFTALSKPWAQGNAQ